MSVNSAANAQAPTAEFEANDTIVCIGNTVSFTDMSTPGGSAISTWAWNFGDGGTSSSQNPSYLFANGGNFIVTLIVTDGGGDKDTITHTIYVLKAQAIQNVVRICSPQNTTTIAAIDPNISGVAGVWFTASSAVIASPGNDTTSVSNLNTGSYIFFWVVSDGVCSDADQVTVIVDQPVTVNAGPDQQICSTPGTATMAGSSPSPGTGLWSTSSSATITSPTNRNTTISGLSSAGTYVFVWTVTNGSCITRDTMQIVVSSPVASAAGSDQAVCSSPGTLTLAGNSPSPGTGLWTTSSAASITTPTSATSAVTGLSTAGTFNFIWTITNGTCVTRDTMQVVVSTPVNSNAGNNIQVCTSTATGTLNGNNPSPGTGLWTALNGGVITSPTSSTTTITGLNTAGFYNFVWTITNGACVTRDTVAIIVRAPITANAGADQTFCNLTTATLTGNSPSPGAAAWTTTGSSTIATPTTATTNVSNLAIGNNTFIYSITYGACVTRDTVVIRRDSLVSANAGPDQLICESQTSVTLAGNSPTPGTGVWTKLNGGTITTPSSPTSIVTGLTAGTHSFVWTITNGTCTSADTVRIVVSAQVASNAGLDDQVCQGGTVSLSANDPTPASGVWTTTSSALIDIPTSADILVTNLTNVGVYTFVWTVTNGGCVQRDTARVTVDSLVVSNAGADQNLCASSTVSLTANAATPGIGLWTSLGSATLSNASNASTTALNLAYGNNTFVWEITNGVCLSSDSVIIRRDSTVNASAGVDKSICIGSPITMTANSPSPGTGLWSALSSGTITSPTSPTTTITGLSTAGTYNFVWTITNGSCISSDTVSIIVSSTVVANAGSDQEICASTTATLAGNAATPGTGAWSSLGTALVTTSSSPTSGVTSLANGANTFVWTITNGACVSSDTVVITVSTLVASIAGADQSLCIGSPIIMAANSPLPGTGLWTALSSGTISSNTSETTTITGLTSAGTYNFVWTITNGSCVSRDTVSIIVNDVITPDAGFDIQLCNTLTTVLNSNDPTPGIGLWSSPSGATIASPNIPSTTVSDMVLGDNIFVWTITNGSCVASDTIHVFVDSVIVPDAGIDQTVCSGTSSVLMANDPTPGTGLWTTSSTANIAIPNLENTPVDNLVDAGAQMFIWTITNGVCSTSDTVYINVDSLIVADAGSDQQLCETFTTTLKSNDVTPGTGTWGTLGSASFVDVNDPMTTVSNLDYGDNVFIWSVTNGTCSSEDTLIVRVDSIINPLAGADQTICSSTGQVVLAANDPSPGIGVWTTSSSAVFADSSQAATTAAGLIYVGSYELIWTIENGTCIASDTVVVTVDSNVVAIAGPDQQFCETTTSTTLAATPTTIGTGVWTTSGAAVIVDVNDPATDVNTLEYGDNIFVWTITNGTCITSDTVIVHVDSLVNATAGADQTICSSVGQVVLAANDPAPGIGTWTTASSAIFADANQAATTASGLNIVGDYELIWTIENGTCISSDTITITVDSNDVAVAGPDQQFCETTTSTTLAATAAIIGTGVWTTPGTAVIVDVNDAATDVNTLEYGDNIFVWTITNGTCITSDTVIVHVDSLVNATAGADQIICSSVGQVVLAANDPAPGIGTWTTTSSAIFADANQAATTASVLNIAGNYDLIWTIENGTCISSDTITITVDSNDVAVAGPDQQFCETTTSTTLAATAATIGAGVWTTPGTAVIVDVNDPATDVNTLEYGDNIFVWTITNGTCVTSDTVIVHVDSLVNAFAGFDQTICSAIGQVVLVANDPAPGIGTWSTATSVIFADENQAGTTATGLAIAGNYDLIWTITNGTCISADTLTITVDSNDVADAGIDQQLCETITSTNLAALPATIGTGVWSTTSAATITDVNDPATSVSNLVIGDNIFVWTITSGTCTTTDTINVVISQQTDPANAGSDQNVCSSLAIATVSGNIPVVGTVTWTSLGSSVVDSATSVTTTVSNLSLGSNLFIYTITNGACSSSDTVDVVMFANPTADAGVDQFTTSGTAVTIGGSPVASGGTAPYTYSWTPGTTLDDSLIANPLATVFATTTFVVTVTDSIGCNAQDTVVVWINNPPVLQNDTLTIDEDSTVVIYPLLNDSDPDNNLNLGTLAILNGPFNGTATIDTITGTITYVPNANYYGQDSIMYTLCDSGMPVYCDTAWIYLTLNPINDAPLAIDDVDSTVEDSCIQIAVLANDTDVENAIIVGSLVTFNGPSNGTLSLDTLTGIITYCPDSNFAGIDTFYYAICDSGYPAPGLCDTAMVVITVNSKNDPPIALNDSVSVCANDSVLIAVLLNDVDSEGDPLSATIVSVPSHGSATVDIAGNIMYVPDPSYSGLDSLEYAVCDNQSPAGCDTAWAFIDVRSIPLLSSVTTTNKCYEDSLGTIDLLITGNAGFVISWDNGSVEEDLDSLASGSYTVTVVDTFGCHTSLTDTIFGPALPLAGTLGLQPVLCHADTSGAIDLQPTGGTSPYYFSWSTGSTDEDIDSLIAGVYTVILSDTNGCQISLTDTIVQPDSALTASLFVTDITCAGDSTGSIHVIPAGGTASYIFLWNNGVLADSLTALPAGLYSVTVKDINGCLITVADSIMELNPAIVLDSIVVQPYCLDNILGSVEVIPSGGLSPFQYVWSTGDTLSVIDTLTSGSYSVQVIDANGCTKSYATTLSDTSNISIQVVGATTFCSGDSVTLTATNSAYVTYQWTNSGSPMTDTLNAITVYSSGDYAVTATAVCGQFTAGPVTVVENSLPIATVDPDMTIHCDSSVILTATGGNTYLWSPANLVSDSTASLVTINLQSTTTFVVTAISAEGCTANDTVVVTVVCDTLFIPGGFSPNGDGVNDYFVISDINRYPDAVLKIFNRWGDLVYTKEHYDNSWNGFSNTDMVRLGDTLPNGTYFYVFEPGNGEDGKSGYVILRR